MTDVKWNQIFHAGDNDEWVDFDYSFPDSKYLYDIHITITSNVVPREVKDTPTVFQYNTKFLAEETVINHRVRRFPWGGPWEDKCLLGVFGQKVDYLFAKNSYSTGSNNDFVINVFREEEGIYNQGGGETMITFCLTFVKTGLKTVSENAHEF